ncbi:glycosyltransferase family 4 protein [Sulfurospirillum barnesii]|uniref:UDP-N-acetylmuramyl pentapeptide phosphotransferase/UDP-N-acetylglucosamine-1-phosphate transferase n=1 Tax=Sulfurospirillum barnesii (strain ATCC 700032 / DSM 10660 / SES-3) TaxID=760154 RepID=I3XYX6_SULBS|nr:MraY family glycosyltransferase [Sulfurospirillum barnesii]AFL69150.1 UDP-N-acetylmuramyl pentapeptide phosphotransferase/UDP-N-acetylglucosamine-1-phosphate transferase [Sulfurospirillum barnesii SES-3]
MALIDIPLSVMLCCVLLLSFTLNLILIRFQNRLPLLDIPNERSSHTKITPRSGGIALFASFLVGIFCSGYIDSLLFLIPVSFVFFVGLYDDMRPLSSKLKLFLTALPAVGLFHMGFSLEHFGTFFGKEIVLSYGFALLFFSFAISGFVSSLNLIDGLDGLASVVSLAILLPFAYMGYKYTDLFLFSITLMLMSSIFGFLLLNWHPSKIFMGDSGSMFLGFMIAIIVVYAIKKEYITAISALFLAGVPILDTLIVMLRRFLQGVHPFKADKTHMHHLILNYHKSIPRTVFILGLLQILFSYIGLGFKVRDDIFIFVLYALVFVLVYSLLTISDKGYKENV